MADGQRICGGSWHNAGLRAQMAARTPTHFHTSWPTGENPSGRNRAPCRIRPSPSAARKMTDQLQTEELQAGVELQIQKIVEQGITKWRAAKQKANPYGHVTVADEFEMRNCIAEHERAKRNLPLEARKQVSQGIEWNVRTYLNAQQNQTTEPPWRIKGLVVDGSATQVSAHPHGMKSLSWLNAALESVTLHTVWGQFDANRVESVLYIESEDPEWLVAARIRGIAKGLGLESDKDVPGFHFACPGPFDFVKEDEGIRGLIAKVQPSFVVLSTLQSVLAGRDWLNQKDMQDVNALIVRLSRICPFVVLTHSPWNKKQRRAAGTITQFANFAITMHYDKVKQAEGGTAIHVVLDSKVGASIDNFYLKLLTEGVEDDPSSVRAWFTGEMGGQKVRTRKRFLKHSPMIRTQAPTRLRSALGLVSGTCGKSRRSVRRKVAEKPQQKPAKPKQPSLMSMIRASHPSSWT